MNLADLKSLRGRDFLSLQDFSSQEIQSLLQMAQYLKQLQQQGIPHRLLQGKTLGMIFTKSSTRTRVSFEVGIYQLGGTALYLNANDLQLGRGETIGDTAKVLSRYLDGIMIRTFDHQDVVDLAAGADIPVINGLTDSFHPCQALADYLTILEYKGSFKGRKIVYIGDGNNVAHSLMYGAVKVGMDIAICSPSGFYPQQEILSHCQELAGTDNKVEIIEDPYKAVVNADVIYTDVWASMGQEAEHAQRLVAFADYQVNSKLISCAKDDVVVMHCLPAHRGEEITDEVLDGPHSIVFDQAENRLHAQKAIMAVLMG